MLEIIGLLITLTALFSYINARFIKLPTTIGVMVIAVLTSVALLVVRELGYVAIEQKAEALVGQIDFYEVFMHGMLSLLLFAGALHIDLGELADRKWAIGVLATIGVTASTFLVGGTSWFLFQALNLEISFIFCLLFGALISPTDPIAVLGILKTAKVPKSLEIKIAGESLFNDGIAVVLFVIIFQMATGDQRVEWTDVVVLFAKEALGGVAFGLLIGFISYRMIRSIDRYDVEILLTLALVLGGYALAIELHVSGPIAMVVAGLMIGNHGRALAMSNKTRRNLDTFWELVDEILNAVLFVLIGFEVLILSFTNAYVIAGLLMAAAVVVIRFACVGVPIATMREFFGFSFTDHSIKILTWGGVRGGVSVALALSLPSGPERDLLVAVTYIVVLFSIVVQGLTIGKLVKAKLGTGANEQPDPVS
jgi:CPA1 family monovalent cation:H+ antiporter